MSSLVIIISSFANQISAVLFINTDTLVHTIKSNNLKEINDKQSPARVRSQ